MITSGGNKLVKEIRALELKKNRDAQGVFVVEGERFADEIPKDWPVRMFVVSQSFPLKEKYKNRAETVEVSDAVFKMFSDTVTPQGVLAVCEQKNFGLECLRGAENPFVLVGEKIADPGNLGTLIRTADAAACDAVILSTGSADVYGSKVVRAAAGSVFHLPIVKEAELSEILPALKNLGVRVAAAHLKADKPPYAADFRRGCAILIGNEANGLSEEAANMSDELIKLPMPGKAESLNASVAGALLLYEVVRQRLYA